MLSEAIEVVVDLLPVDSKQEGRSTLRQKVLLLALFVLIVLIVLALIAAGESLH